MKNQKHVNPEGLILGLDFAAGSCELCEFFVLFYELCALLMKFNETCKLLTKFHEVHEFLANYQ
jgi:hypothetical protein